MIPHRPAPVPSSFDSPNVFSALFAFRPREGHTPKENFLSEAFVYALRTNELARRAWIRMVLGEDSNDVEISTRATSYEHETGRSIYPDVEYRGTTSVGRFVIRAEHKWDSDCDRAQLDSYARLFRSPEGACHLVFVGAKEAQRGDALSFPVREYPNVTFHALSWQDIFTELSQVPDEGHTILQELLEFMEQEGLSPGPPMQERTMVAFLESIEFRAQLLRFAEKLRNEYDWEILPARYRTSPGVTDRWGRVAIEFATETWAPTITVGFLYSGANHAVALTNPSRGIDLMLRLETSPQNHRGLSIAALSSHVQALRLLGATVQERDDRTRRNRNTLLIVQKCLGEVIDNLETEVEQVEAIAGTLRSWLAALFEDGSLEPALCTIVPH